MADPACIVCEGDGHLPAPGRVPGTIVRRPCTACSRPDPLTAAIAERDAAQAEVERLRAELDAAQSEAGRYYREAEGQKRRAKLLDERCVAVERERDALAAWSETGLRPAIAWSRRWKRLAADLRRGRLNALDGLNYVVERCRVAEADRDQLREGLRALADAAAGVVAGFRGAPATSGEQALAAGVEQARRLLGDGAEGGE